MDVIIDFADVEVKNVLSSLTASIEVAVLYPEPKDLQIVLVADDLDRPSCSPDSLDLLPSDEAATLFVNSTARLEASIAVGTNVTFVFELSDSDRSLKYRPFEADPPCMGQNCTVIVQVCSQHAPNDW